MVSILPHPASLSHFPLLPTSRLVLIVSRCRCNRPPTSHFPLPASHWPLPTTCRAPFHPSQLPASRVPRHAPARRFLLPAFRISRPAPSFPPA
ncbi:hypothetical protein CLOM_g17619 [Closterium sp. NIES-68]|nr:hypothetical protein CLOM_g17619 [Closterium sp. NIES-68]GJP70955.1 hypothetical protein CLOP_g1848 [Closterium sp. NIES-67]